MNFSVFWIQIQQCLYGKFIQNIIHKWLTFCLGLSELTVMLIHGIQNCHTKMTEYCFYCFILIALCFPILCKWLIVPMHYLNWGNESSWKLYSVWRCNPSYPNGPEAGREAGWGFAFVPLKKRQVGSFILLQKISWTACCFGIPTFLKQYNCYESATIWYTDHQYLAQYSEIINNLHEIPLIVHRICHKYSIFSLYMEYRYRNNAKMAHTGWYGGSERWQGIVNIENDDQ